MDENIEKLFLTGEYTLDEIAKKTGASKSTVQLVTTSMLKKNENPDDKTTWSEASNFVDKVNT